MQYFIEINLKKFRPNDFQMSIYIMKGEITTQSNGKEDKYHGTQKQALPEKIQYEGKRRCCMADVFCSRKIYS